MTPTSICVISLKRITIDVVLGELPCEFLDLEKFGTTLCGWNSKDLSCTEEPGEGLETALRVRLAVSNDLEPTWSVIRHEDDDGVPFRANDRAKVAVSLIGITSDRHLTWSRGSILNRITETESLSSSLADAARAAKSALDSKRQENLDNFDRAAGIAEQTSRALGVRVAESYKAHLDTDAINVRIAGLALHDGDIPLRQLGMGSKRMLTTGLQKEAFHSPHITLFDEVEVGLEPHRISRLLQHLREDEHGQYFLTTHSPVVLRELSVGDLQIVHRDGGKINVVAADKPAIAETIQGKIRSGAEAFLAPKIVVCEGATEVGFLRGLDDHWVTDENKPSFAYLGIASFDAGGASKIKKLAETLHTLGYDVAVFCDSDDSEQFSEEHADALRGDGITVVKWDDGLSIEERIFADIPWESVASSFAVACGIWEDSSRLVDQVETQFGPGFERDYRAWTDTRRLRAALGKAAKASHWFKRQNLGREWAGVISPYLGDDSIRDSDLVRQLKLLRSWIDNG